MGYAPRMGFPAPFRREGLARRSWPLALALVIAFAAVPITPGQARLGPLAVAALLSAVAGLAALLSPWDRLPVWASVAPPIAVIVAIALLRHAEGGAESVYAALFVLPVLWLALYGTARQVIFALGVVGVMFLAPLVFLGEPDYPTSDWSRGLFIVLVCASVGLAVQRLVVSLQSREGETRMIIDRAHDAFVSIDIHGRITDWNSQAERTFGWPAGDAIGASLIDTVIPPVDRDEYWRGLGRFTATGECRLIDDRGEMTAVRREGSEVPVEVSVIAVPDGTPSCLHLFFRDLTRRKRAARHDAVQHGVAAVLAESVTLDDAIPSVLETVASGLGWEIATYWAPEGDTDLLVARHVWHDGSPAAARFASATRPLVLTTGAELPGIAWETRSPAWVEDVTTESDAVTARHAIAGEVGLHGAVALPMAVDEGAQGVVEFISHDVRRPDDELIKVMDTVTIQLGQFIERVRRTEELHHVEEVSRTDTLTGLPNRRGWDRELPRELARAVREGRPVCVALLDIDDFKGFNDEQGHLAGDRALREAGAAWRTELRATDVIARFGGDEFAAIFPDCPLHMGLDLIRRLGAATPQPLTVSAGVGQWDGSESREELLTRIDDALYDAKSAGRNCAVIAQPGHAGPTVETQAPVGPTPIAEDGSQ